MNWLHGKLADHITILGIQVFWIARVAKIVEFGSGSVIVLDWIGANTLNAWIHKLEESLQRRWNWLTGIRSKGTIRGRSSAFLRRFVIVALACCSVALVTIYLDWNAKQNSLVNENLHSFAAAVSFSLEILIGLFLLCIVAIGVAYTIVLIVLAALERLIKLIDRNQDDPKRALIMMSFLLLLIGFIMDFATS